MNTLQSPFHGYFDQPTNPAEDQTQPALVVKTGTPIIIKERAVGYRFFPHFHPFATKLAQRLTNESVRGLQAADTEYVKGSVGTWQILPNTTMVQLDSDLIVD